MKAIINGKIILKDKIIEDYALLYSDIIEGVVPVSEIPADCEVLDAEGGFIAPGLIDLHIHGYLGRDVCDATEESIRIISEGLIKNGVTGYLPTTMTVDMKVIKKALEVLRGLKEESKGWRGSEILGCHAEGPFICEAKKGAQDAAFILKPDAEFVKEYSDIIKIITLAPEEDENFSAIKEISENTSVVVSMGHTSASYETAIEGVKNGVKHATHLFNAMTPLTHRAPGVVGAALNSSVSAELIVDTFHVDRALFDLVWRLKGDKLCFITDCLPAGGLSEGEYTLGGAKIIYKDDLCYLSDGKTIAGSVLRLNQGVMNVFKNSNIPLYECVNCASLNPAKVVGIDSHKGSLEAGKDADIIIADENFEIKKTIIRGEIRYES